MPTLVPARMVNEFAYCPRLFFLEWVQGRFEDNADTVDGRYQHRAVDVEAGRAPPPELADELRSARSVLVGSERLGLIARADILEGDFGAVVPVEVKRGRPPDDAPAWEPELVQLCVVALLLRDNGYVCNQGRFFFAETRESRHVEFDEAIVARTVELLAALRDVAACDEAPPPLDDSPKCPRCSLVGICLPDETNLLAGRVQLRKGRETLHEARLIDLSQVNVYGQIMITTGLLTELFARQVPVLWFSHGGWFRGIASGLPSKHVELRRRQVAVAAHGGLQVARQMVRGKIRNSRTLLMRNSPARPDAAIDTLKSLADAALNATSIAELLGIEGAAARLYFQYFGPMLKPTRHLPGREFSFEHRNRRPPTDPVNCLLSFLYGLLAKDLTVVTNAVGFDPFLGFYHRPRFGRPALALDLTEEFRSLVADSAVLTLVNNAEVTSSDFVVRAGGVALTSAGRKAVLAAYERRLETEVTHPTFGYKITYRRVLEVQARVLAAHVLGEIPEYTAFTTR